ncbi:hypothetical protein C1H46_013603 [Malus baccata]|uniref:Uncharacterized protein n=1 Tax=Malus baccata TaxID=106549 RepID=A0A540MPT9_MALBA|nr:hypothetical protein C1H46_013603 [Malus baccata]
MVQARQCVIKASSSLQPQSPNIIELTYEVANLRSKLMLIINSLSSNGFVVISTSKHRTCQSSSSLAHRFTARLAARPAPRPLPLTTNNPTDHPI